MIIRIVIVLLILLQNIQCFGQINTFLKTFSTTPGFNTSEYFVSGIDTLSKNSFVSTGTKMRSSLNINDTLIIDGYIQKTEMSGLTKWLHNYHINGYTLALKDIQVILNKEILAVGQTDDYGTPDGNLKHGIILKTDSNGYPIWCRLYPRQKIYNITRRTDGNIAVLATDSGSWYGKNLKIALLNPSGNLIWCKRLLSPDSNFYGAHMREGINKSFLINSNYKLMILLDSNGNHINDISYSLSSPGKGFHNVINYYNQYYYFTGFNIFASQLVSTITKTDASLNIIWHKNYQSLGGDSEFQNIIALSPNNLMIFCEPENYGFNPGIQRSGFAFFDSSGVFKKSHLFTSDSAQVIPEEIINLNNGKFLFTAYGFGNQYFGVVDTASGTFCKQTQIVWNNVSAAPPVNTSSFTSINATFNYSFVPAYVYQPIDASIEYICSNGPTGPLDPILTSIDKDEDETFLKIFPVPSHGFIFIELAQKIEWKNSITIKLFNSLGRQLINNIAYTEAKYFPLDLRSFPDGIYYLSIKLDSDKTITKKIILTRN